MWDLPAPVEWTRRTGAQADSPGLRFDYLDLGSDLGDRRLRRTRKAYTIQQVAMTE